MSTVPAAPVAAPLASIPDFPPDTASVPRPQRNTCAPPRAPMPNDEFTLDDIELGVLAGDDEPWDTWCVAPSHHHARAGTPERGESSNLVSSLTSPQSPQESRRANRRRALHRHARRVRAVVPVRNEAGTPKAIPQDQGRRAQDQGRLDPGRGRASPEVSRFPSPENEKTTPPPPKKKLP